jgi:urease accessory protein
MLIQEKIGNMTDFSAAGRTIDPLPIEWYETGKRIMRKHTRGGRELALRFLRESPSLTEGDVLYADKETIIIIELLACEVIAIRMTSLETVAAACYEIGNRHLPLFIGENSLLAPFEEPLYRWLKGAGYEVEKEERKLRYPLRSTVAGHAHTNSGSSLFSKIMQLTNPRT